MVPKTTKMFLKEQFRTTSECCSIRKRTMRNNTLTNMVMMCRIDNFFATTILSKKDSNDCQKLLPDAELLLRCRYEKSCIKTFITAVVVERENALSLKQKVSLND